MNESTVRSQSQLRLGATELIQKLSLHPFRSEDWGTLVRLLEEKENNTPLGYGDTWTYLTQAANGYALHLSPTGYLALRLEAVIVVGLFRRPLDGNLAIHLINPLGNRRVELLEHLCELAVGIPVYIKKADPSLREQLVRSKHFHWTDEAAWHQDAPEEDDTFPEIELDVRASLARLEAGRLNQAGDKFARFLKRTKDRGTALRWVPLSEGTLEDARMVINQFFDFKDKEQIHISLPSDYENMLVFPQPGATTQCYLRQLCYIDDVPSAMLVMEQIGSSDTLGLYCNLALYQTHPYLSEYVVHHALTHAQKLGFNYLNMGGSESSGLSGFKHKFAPLRYTKRQWFVYKPKDS